MTVSSLSPDVTTLATQMYGRLFRLALLLTGDTRRASQLTVQAFVALPNAIPDPELALARRLLDNYTSSHRARPSWRPQAADLEQSSITPSVASTLVTTLWKATPAARLVLGLHTLWGLTPADTAAAAGQPIEVLFGLQAELAIALGFVSADADRATLISIAALMAATLQPEEAAEIRGRILEDAAIRAYRDELQASEHEIRRIVPALFAVSPPDDLLDRIEQALARPVVQQSGRTRKRLSPTLILTGIVVLVIVGLLFVPLVWPRNQTLSGGSSQVVQPPAEVIEAAIHRLDEPKNSEGVLHEVYRGTLGQESWRQERWYDFASPHRLSVVLHEGDNQTPVYTLTSDGEGRVQYGIRNNRRASGRLLQLTATLPPDEMQEVFPILRQQPDSTFFRTATPPDLGRFFLAQARTSTLSNLGATTFLGRSALLFAYTTDTPLPAEARNGNNTQPGQVLLTIDRATNSLLDVTVLLDGAGEGAALHPWRAELFEIQASVDDALFSPVESDSRTVSELLNPRAPFSFTREPLSLEGLLRSGETPMYLPQSLPDTVMRGMVIRGDQPMVVYEGEFRSIVVALAEQGANADLSTTPSSTAGNFTYQLESTDDGSVTPISSAVALNASSGQPVAQIYLLDQFATPEERENTLKQVISSLEPLTSETIDALGRPFYRSPSAGGEGR